MKRQSAVFVTVPAEDLVGDFRRRHQPRAVARLLPPHITVIPPFWRDDANDEPLVAALTEHFASVRAFDAELVGVGAFARHVWLAPAPQERFARLLTDARARFPELAPAEENAEPVPHMTIAEIRKGESVRHVAQRAEDEIGSRLPLPFAVPDVALFEVRPEGWHELRRFELA